MPKIIFAVVAAALSFAATIGFVHIFQLNSYRHKRYLKWAGEHKERFYPYAVSLFLSALLASFLENALGYILLILIMAVISLSSLFKKAKKPLVYTKRVQRLLLCLAIFYILIAIASIYANAAILLMGICFSLCGAVILLADIINMPIEKAINRYYINDAKKILASARDRLKVIGITGSYGKTSVKFYLTSLLSAKYDVICTPESFNTPLGVVRTIRSSLSAMHNIFVCEMGAKNIGDIKEICDIVHPDFGIITSVGPQHLETFKTLDNVKKTKFELAENIKGGLLFINGDDENILDYNKNPDAVRYGLGEGNDYRARIISVTSKGTEFEVTSREDGKSCVFSTKLIGSHNVINITGAIACANRLGVPLEALVPKVRKLASVPHRLELIKRGNVTIIDDAYNSNPSGSEAALSTLSLFDGFKILVTPGMVELGDRQEEYNYNFGKRAAGVCDFVALVGKKQTESILKGLLDSGYPKERIFVADNLGEAINKVYSISCEEEKFILLENDLPDNFL